MPPRTKATKTAGTARKPVGRPPTKRAREAASNASVNEKTNFAKRLKRKEQQQSGTDTVEAAAAAPSTAAEVYSVRPKSDMGAVSSLHFQDMWLAERRHNARLHDEQQSLRDAVRDRDRFIQMQLSAAVCQTYVNRYGQDDVDEFLRRVRTDLVQHAHEQLGSVPPSHPSYAHREFIANLSDQVDALVRDSFAMRGFCTEAVADDNDNE